MLYSHSAHGYRSRFWFFGDIFRANRDGGCRHDQSRLDREKDHQKIRAYSKAVLRGHGMAEAGVRLPIGPPFSSREIEELEDDEREPTDLQNEEEEYLNEFKELYPRGTEVLRDNSVNVLERFEFFLHPLFPFVELEFL